MPFEKMWGNYFLWPFWRSSSKKCWKKSHPVDCRAFYGVEKKEKFGEAQRRGGSRGHIGGCLIHSHGGDPPPHFEWELTPVRL